tara:strand:- start:207 stop:362 length:156 start_codon:yes stop_codon:yes gene_type:complete
MSSNKFSTIFKKRIKPELYTLSWIDLYGDEVRFSGSPKQIIQQVLTMEEIE